VFGGLVLTMSCGILANQVDSGPLFGGLRNYLRAMPLFFLPVAYAFEDRQLRKQLNLLFGICLLQCPLALYQRLSTLARGNQTGDETAGTLISSGILSLFLVCAGCVLTAAFLRKRISLKLFLPLFLLLVAPTMINETKVTLVVLPLGLLMTLAMGSHPGARLRNTFLAVCLLGIFGAIFVPVYDYFVSQGHGFHNPKIGELLSNQGRVGRYLDTGAEVGARKAGRFDALEVPLEEIARDPVSLAFGFGLGNASESALGLQFTGRYFERYKPFLLTTASTFMLEIGLLGLLGVLTLYLMVFNDSRVVARSDPGIVGTLAIAWPGVVAIVTVGTFYTITHVSAALSYLFWYFSGVIAAERVRLWTQQK
jgi:hypothetical protein